MALDYYVEHNVNPQNRRVGDCVIRAISTALGQDWERTYLELCIQGFIMADMPSSNSCWASFLRGKGYSKKIIPNDCYTVEDFCKDHPKGTFILGTGTHAICAKDGKFYDIWNSSNETIEYYFTKDEE